MPDPVPSPSCPHMAALVELLGELPTDRAMRRPEVVAERLEQLAHEARAHGAPETTLAAIQGARVLLKMSEQPPEARSES